MRKRSQILATITLVLAVCALALICFWTPPEYYGGKPLKYWLKMLSNNPHNLNPPAEWKKLGTNEITVLIKALKLRDSKLQAVYEKLFNSAWNGTGLPIFKRLPAPLRSDDAALNAMLILSQMGTNGRPAFPALIHVLQKDRTGFLRDQSAYALAAMDPSDSLVRPALVASLSDTNLNPLTIKNIRPRLKETERKPLNAGNSETR